MSRKTLLVAALWALLAGGLGGCDASGPGGTATRPASPAPAKDYTGTDLKAALLTGADLPAGFSIDNQPDAGEAAMSSCPEEALALTGYRHDAKAKAAIAFAENSGQFIAQSLVLMAGNPATTTLGKLKAAVGQCTTWTIEGSTYRLSGTTLDRYGDESVGYQVSVQAALDYAFAMVFIRRANVLMAVQVIGVGARPPASAAAIVAAADRRFAAL